MPLLLSLPASHRRGVVRSTDGTQATLTFIAPTGSGAVGENRLVVASTMMLTAAQLAFNDAQAYNTGNGTYGAGYQLRTGNVSASEGGTVIPGAYIVFAGSNSTFTVTNLTSGQEYFFYAIDYNNLQTLGAENYLNPAQPIALPVELTAFTATLRNAKVSLAWSTASEKNSKGFEVQRSQNGKTFATLQFVAGQGSTSSATNYAAVDAQPLGGTSYYRLKQVDYDGTFAYSPVAVITNGGAITSEVSLYPNPAQDVVTVSLGQLPAAGARVTVADMMGRLVLSDKLGANGELSIAQLQAGTYIVTVETGGQKISRKLAKTN